MDQQTEESGIMAGSLNKVMLIGNLGRDPESRSFQNGGRVVNLNLAVSETWKDKHSGERKERTEWVTVAIFNEGLGDVAQKYLRKGSKVYICGKLQTRKWQDQSGVDRYSTEVVLNGFGDELILLDGKAEIGERKQPYGSGDSDPFGADLDDGIPF